MVNADIYSGELHYMCAWHSAYQVSSEQSTVFQQITYIYNKFLKLVYDKSAFGTNWRICMHTSGESERMSHWQIWIVRFVLGIDFLHLNRVSRLCVLPTSSPIDIGIILSSPIDIALILK
jgi:hypothetical protein